MYENSPVVQRELYKGACAPQAPFSTAMPKICISVRPLYFCTCSGSTYIKIGTIQRRLAWPLRKDDTQIREAFQIFDEIYKYSLHTREKKQQRKAKTLATTRKRTHKKGK